MASNATIEQESATADEEMASLMREFGKDIEVTKLAEMGDKKGADIQVTLYHAIDNHPWTGPLYMTTGEGGAMSLLKYRFSVDQVRAMGMDSKWVGKRVWFKDPQPPSTPQGKIMCRFHIDNTPEKQAEALSQGVTPFCSHKTQFLTAYAEDRHVKKRHPNTYAYLATNAEVEDRMTARSQAEAMAAQSTALLAIAESLKASQTPVGAPSAPEKTK